MIEKKCKICGEWKPSKNIAMHYWNLHRAKYKEYKGNEEERNLVEPIITEEINKEEYVLETQKEDYIAINKVEQKQIEEETNEKKANKEEGTNNTATTTKVINEVYRPYNTVIKPEFYDEGEVINEWC